MLYKNTNTNFFNSSFQSSKVPLTIQEFNSDEKVEEVNRLINILSSRKKLSIIVSMLMFFQEKNYPKILKDYLIEGVKDFIDNNPGRVISYNGDPFTRENCFMGMRVVIGKHRVFLKEVIDGVEYLHVNLSTTANFLSDEISKICVGPRNNRPIHSSLCDDPKFEYKNHNLVGDKTNLGNISFDQNENLNNSKKCENNKKIGTDDAVGINEDSDFDINSNNLDMRDDDEFSEGQEEKILKKNNNNAKGNIINLGESEDGEQNDEFNFAKPNNINCENKNENKNNLNKNIINDDNIDEDDIELKNISETENYSEAPKLTTTNSSLFSKEFRDIDVKLLQNKSRRNNKNKNKNPLEINKSKYSFQEIISIKNFGRFSPVNSYLKENKESIEKYLELFNLLQTIGQEGQKQFERLEKLNPSNNQDDSKSQISNSENENNMEEIFNEFEIKKDNLIRTYKRINSTVGSIYTISNNNEDLDNNLIKDDINYLNFNSKLYNKILEEMFPLFDLIHSQTQHFSIANITKNLQKISDSLKQNDVGFKNFFVFVQSLINRIPMGAIKGNNLCDILGDEKEEIEERKKHFYEILNKEKDDLLNVIKPMLEKYNLTIENNDLK